MIILPTGMGKTRVVGAIGEVLIQQELKERRRWDARPLLFTAHREGLIRQLAESIGRDLRHIPEVEVGIEMGEIRASSRNIAIVASIPTIGRENSTRLIHVERRGCSLFFIDEVHHAAADGYIRAADRYANKEYHPDTPLLGVTATNHRLDKKQIVRADGSTIMDKVVYQLTLLDGMRMKYLCPLRAYKVVTTTDISKVGMVAGDFNQKALEKEIDKTQRTQEAIKRWMEIAEDRITIVFCVSIAHAVHSAKQWCDAGYSFGYIHSGMSDADRELTMLKWKRGEIQGVCNVGVLTEGFDFPPINCVVQLRPTQSWVLYCQTVGRGTRPSPETGKVDCIVLDVVDNTGKHDIVTAPMMVDLGPMDINGMSLEEAVDEVEKAKKQGRKRVEKPISIKDITTSVVEVDLMKESALPGEVSRMSKMAWQKVGNGYVLALGPGRDSKPESATLTKDALGHWRIKLQGECAGSTGKKELGNSYGEADVPSFPRADQTINFMFNGRNNKMTLVDAKAEWRNRPAGKEQINFLVSKLGVPFHEAARMNGGQASNLIAKHMLEGWRYPK